MVTEFELPIQVNLRRSDSLGSQRRVVVELLAALRRLCLVAQIRTTVHSPCHHRDSTLATHRRLVRQFTPSDRQLFRPSLSDFAIYTIAIVAFLRTLPLATPLNGAYVSRSH